MVSLLREYEYMIKLSSASVPVSICVRGMSCHMVAGMSASFLPETMLQCSQSRPLDFSAMTSEIVGCEDFPY